jgi:NAD+ synthetase
MPSPYSSEHSLTDAEALAANLGIRYAKLPITEIFKASLHTLKATFDGLKEDAAEQNIQARIRGNLLMAMANKFGGLALSTGNKSELSVGYCTLYGDMAGGLAPLADVPKTTVYALAHYINRAGEVIPKNSIDKPPSAELKADQTDQDDLPPYEVLDRILELYVEQAKSPSEIVRKGIPRKIVDDIIDRIDRNEYKRRQAPPGLKIAPKSFGMGRRMPLARGYHR